LGAINAVAVVLIVAVAGVVAWDATDGSIAYAPAAVVHDFMTSGPSVPMMLAYVAVIAIPPRSSTSSGTRSPPAGAGR
jgi:hypothetical protein